MTNKDILNFIFELGQLKRIKHEGWRLIGVEFPESVADHCLRAAQIGYILAKMEKYENPFEVCSMVVFHDIVECRIGDIHRVANRYVSVETKKVAKDQVKNLDAMGEEILEMYGQADERSSAAGIIAKDADRLDMAVTAKEYKEKGYAYAQDWIDNISKSIRTESAKKLMKELENSDSNQWWPGLKKLKG